MGTGVLYVISTPIGNLEDITIRSLNILRQVGLIAAEDTRRTKKLLSHYNIHTRMISYHSHSARERGSQIIERLKEGIDIALVTDAGTPGVSDPGFLLIKDALDRGLPVVVLPGPSAVITALVVSGLPTQPFTFLGFPPRGGSKRLRFFAAYKTLPFTTVIFEAPKRLRRTLMDIHRFWGNRKIAVAREMTKRFEEVFRGTVSEAINHFCGEVKGEITLVVEGMGEVADPEKREEDWRGELEELILRNNMSIRDATAGIVKRFSLPHRVVYKEALKIRRSGGLE